MMLTRRALLSTAAVLAATRGHALVPPARGALLTATDFPGVDPTGVADSTAGLRAAAAAIPEEGGAIMLPPGRYRVSDSILLRSGTRVFSPGGTTIFTQAMRGMLGVVHPAEDFRGAAFGNLNHGAKNLADHDIAIENITFDWGTANGSNSHILRFISARRVRVRDCVFTGQRYGDAVAFLACDNCTVEDCHAENFVNAALDAWHGCTRLRFLNNTLVTGPGCVQVINVNGMGDRAENTTSSDFVITGNQITLRDSAATAIYLGTLATGAKVVNGRITDNTIIGDPRQRGYGIVGRGLGGRFIVAANHLIGLGPAPPIWMDTGYYDGKTATPTPDCVVVNNIISDAEVTQGPFNKGHAAAIALTGDGHYCAGNRIVGGKYEWLVWSNSASTVLGPNLGSTGSLGRYGDDGFHHALVLDADPQSGAWRVQGDLSASGRLILPNVPTSPQGLPKGAVWSNRGVLSVVP
ncbi:MAG: glycosyl hydrolase family 28-related protein [Alphaproteobacteria bacterium]|nr:glycosyl hydrolase family 28-related protein [Alphaproteobacteria bacterium]